jgi:hypothetical protein
MHDAAAYFALFAEVDPDQYYLAVRATFREFFVGVEALLERSGFAPSAEAALVARCLGALAEDKQALADEVERYRLSRSYRLGRLLTAPLGWCRRLLHRNGS